MIKCAFKFEEWVIEESFSSGSSEEDSDESDLSDIIDSGDD